MCALVAGSIAQTRFDVQGGHLSRTGVASCSGLATRKKRARAPGSVLEGLPITRITSVITMITKVMFQYYCCLSLRESGVEVRRPDCEMTSRESVLGGFE